MDVFLGVSAMCRYCVSYSPSRFCLDDTCTCTCTMCTSEKPKSCERIPRGYRVTIAGDRNIVSPYPYDPRLAQLTDLQANPLSWFDPYLKKPPPPPTKDLHELSGGLLHVPEIAENPHHPIIRPWAIYRKKKAPGR